MKVDEEYKDIYGTYCLRFNTTNLQKIHEFLSRNYQGYKFAIILDYTKDEIGPAEGYTLVYFGDSALDELAYTYDYELVKMRRVNTNAESEG